MFVSTQDNIDIYYNVQGPEHAPCIIFAHGAGGNAAIWWQQIPYFIERYRVICFDHRAFARSKCPPESFSPIYFESDLLAIMDQENIEKAALVCQSMGGWTGVRMAAFHPERVACLFLANTPGAIPSDELSAQLRSLPVGPNVPPVSQLAISARFRERSPQVAALYQLINDFTVQTPPLARLMAPEVFLSQTELNGFNVPTMVLSSDLDVLFPRNLLEASACKIGARTTHVTDSGHSTYYEQPVQFNDLVGKFIGEYLL